ncbi:hypothetical protein TNCV_4801671 [Trichonephila clavipes]|nr:hypothetical protein TNCV_4801671 [Trichonephila clavipes]
MCPINGVKNQRTMVASVIRSSSVLIKEALMMYHLIERPSFGCRMYRNINASLSLSSLLNYSRAFGDGPVARVAKWSRYRIMVDMPRVRAQCHKRPAV